MDEKLKRISKSFPRQNLPPSKSRKRTESLFLHAFAYNFKSRLLLQKSNKKYILARELDLNGYGIADLIFWEYHIKNSENYLLNTTITAFEIKIKDWKRAIIQAYRYKYYSNRAIVVIPTEYSNKAILNKKLFQDLDVGLWAFDKKDQKISKIYTPRKRKPINEAAREKALNILNRKFKFLQEI